MVVALSGNDTILMNGRLLDDLADQDAAVLTFPNDIANTKTGKNGNTIFALNEMGNVAELVLRIVRASADDKFLNNLLVQQLQNFAGTVLVQGSLVKQVGDGAGNVTNDTYILSNGIFQKLVEAKTNVEGDTEQSVSIYRLKFSSAPRAIT